MERKEIFYIVLSLVLAWFFAAKMPQALFIPLAILLWVFRAGFVRLAQRFPAGLGFIGSAWLLGMVIEIFAVWQNLSVPAGQRLLFEQEPGRDLAVAAVFYLFFAVIWFFLLRRYAFTPRQALFIQVLWSAVEQRGAVLKQAFQAGSFGLVMLAFVAGVYGTWVFFPTLFTWEKFSQKFPDRIKPRWYHMLLAVWILYAAIAVMILLS